MTFEEFERRANGVFQEIPREFRDGIGGLEILPKIVYHPELDGIYTLGECLTEAYPSEFGGAGEVHSRVVLYYGSFVQISKEDEEWDWDEEIYETITHEIRHHLEHLASDEALEEMDYAEDQNFARQEGAEFEPYFYRSGEVLGGGTYRVGNDLFMELPVTGLHGGERLEAIYDGWSFVFAAPAEMADVHFLDMAVACGPETGPALTVVLLRRQSAWTAFRSVMGTLKLRVASSDAVECVVSGGGSV